MSARGSSFIGQRNEETVQDGQRPEGSRDERRAYNFLKKRAAEKGSRLEKQLELREAVSRKPTARSRNWQKQQQQKRGAEVQNPEQRDTARASIDDTFCDPNMQYHTTDCLRSIDPDEPCYNIGPHTASIPICAMPSHNLPNDTYDLHEYGQEYEMDW